MASAGPILEASSRRAVGCSAREAIWQAGKLTLYRYTPIARPNVAAPLLIVSPLVNRPHMMDLQPDRSLVRGLLSQGIDVHLIDWGYPDGADRFLTLADYADRLIAACVEQLLQRYRLPSLNMLGVCQGGVLSLCFTALHPDRVRNLVTMVTPVDFHTPSDLLSKWVRKIDITGWVGDRNVPGETLNQLFLALMPFRLTQQKYVHLLFEQSQSADRSQLEDFLRVEQWIFDSPDQAGAAFRQFVIGCYQENRLVRGTMELAGQHVNLQLVRSPVLNLIGKRDHLVPPEASAVLQRYVGSQDYTLQEFDLGHIGMYISARAQREVPAAIANWLARR